MSNETPASRTTSEIVSTANFRRIGKFLNGTRRNAQFSYLFGPSGYGKSFAAKHWVRENGNAAYIYAETNSTQSRLRRQISRAIFGADDYSVNEIRKYMMEHPGFVLIIDECNHLIMDLNRTSVKCLDSIRDYYDVVNDDGGQLGVCFIFTDYTLERLSKCRMASFLQQFINRIDNHLCLNAKNFRKNEIEPTVKHYFPDAGSEIYEFACQFRDLRSVHKRLKLAKKIWGDSVSRENLDDIQQLIATGEREDK